MGGDACSDHELLRKAQRVRLLFTDCDGVLTDAGVYYSAGGEQLKRFHIRDGMGVERLRTLAGVETAIISGETSPALRHRAAKLQIHECHLGIRQKAPVLQAAAKRLGVDLADAAYIGDDVNDLESMALVGLSACPADAMVEVIDRVDFVCELNGGQGAFREFAEMIIRAHASCGSGL